jgi:hypothetical protein
LLAEALLSVNNPDGSMRYKWVNLRPRSRDIGD